MSILTLFIITFIMLGCAVIGIAIKILLKKNGEFAISLDDQNNILKEKIRNVANKIEQGLPSIPVSLKEELDTNIFLRCENEKIKSKLQMHNASKLEVFTKLRNLKDQF